MTYKLINTGEHACLVSVCHTVFAPENLRSVIKDLSSLGKFDRASSVYRVFVDGQIQYTVTLLLKTNLSFNQVYAEIQKYEKSDHHSRVLLLCYDNEVCITPELTVPYPKWVTEAHILVPSAEVWGDFFHPIEQENLYFLAQKFSGQPWGEFFAQGAMLFA